MLALTVNWWVRWQSVEPVQSAIAETMLGHWVPVVRSALCANKSRGRTPTTWTDLARLLGLDYLKMYRRREGIHRMSAEEFLSVASLLDVPWASLLPSSHQLVTGATQVLSEGRLPDGHAGTYARYCLALPASRFLVARRRDQRIDNLIVRDLCIGRAVEFEDVAECEQAIRQVAEQLEPALEMASLEAFRREQ